MNAPAIPPDRALAVGGRLDAATATALREARRIRDGWQAALDAAAAEAHAETARRLARALAALRRWSAAERRRLRGEALALAARLAERLVGERIAGDPAALLETIDAAAAEIRPGPWLDVHLHPQDAAALTAALRLPAGVRVLADPGLRPGDVLLAGPAGRVDARVATRVARLAPPEPGT